MKRSAETQISKDDVDGDDDVEEGEGFVKADESVLATRRIRALPKRANPAANPPPGPVNGTAADTSSSPRFGNFSGFGATATNSSPFSFTAPSPDALAPPSMSSSSLFGRPSSTLPTNPPSVSSTASSATKTFASFLGSSPALSSSSPSSSLPALSSDPPSSNTPSTVNGDDNPAASKYYKCLRGLNVSFMAAMSKAVEADPFVDAAELLEHYKELRVTVQTEFENSGKGAQKGTSTAKAETSKSGASAGPASLASNPFGSSKPPASGSSPSMPAPPSGFSGFGSFPPQPTSSSPASGGFTPEVDSSVPADKSSAFGFPTSTSSTSTETKSAFTFGSSDSNSTSNKSAFAIASETSPSNPSPFGAPAADSTSMKPDFTFGPSTTSTPVFGSTSDAFKKVPSAFTGGAFGLTKEKVTDSAGTSSSLFGASSAFGSTPKVPQSSSNSAFTFGSSTPGKTNSPFSGFGKPSGSIGNPVGFGFGSPPRTPDALSAPSASTGFDFSTKVEEQEKDSSQETEKSGGEAGPEGGEEPDRAQSVSTNVHDEVGEGEEEEETTHSVKSKVFKFTKDDKDVKGKWVDMGVGILRLKKHKENGGRRLLLRNSSTGRVIINFKVYAGLQPKSPSNKIIAFTGHEDGSPVNYQLRVKTPEDATTLHQALDREIEFVKGKSE